MPLTRPLFSVAALATLVACSPAAAPPAPSVAAPLLQCAKDTDCKGDRICEDGRCTDPGTPALARAATASAADATAADTRGAAHAALEHVLLKALRMKPGTQERGIEPGEAVKAFIDAGLVARAPDYRADYSDYRRLRSPIPFLGHELLALDEEYMAEYVGCCVSPGMAVALRLRPGGADLDAFAREAGCSVDRDTDGLSLIDAFDLPAAPKGTYAAIKCKERDLPVEE
ncbi:hypothetical protein [Lysobacter sp. N42]|uniref:hypothetical protein n=1 Tax=Lysobacter sp. N42 TaxID=2545719 RepID=UPI001050439D|nr:hypothetical protein [Lysobacter sp. N42]TCZ85027.1 hypothetical protein EYQ95_19455 [Lysobacter sp. N42]